MTASEGSVTEGWALVLTKQNLFVKTEKALLLAESTDGRTCQKIVCSLRVDTNASVVLSRFKFTDYLTKYSSCWGTPTSAKERRRGRRPLVPPSQSGLTAFDTGPDPRRFGRPQSDGTPGEGFEDDNLVPVPPVLTSRRGCLTRTSGPIGSPNTKGTPGKDCR